jgi:hypothetical protein
MNRALSAPAWLLLWCLGGAALAQAILARIGAGNPDGFSPIFWYLLSAYDTHGNVVLLAVIAVAFALKRRPFALKAISIAAERPWALAAVAFPLLCLAARRVYHDYPLSMDENASLFQANVFAAGRLSGNFPPELMDRLIPPFFQSFFFAVSHTRGDIASTYWPGFALLMAPFAWLGVPWATNPALGALTIPVLHRLAKQIGGSKEAGGWAIALALASPVFVVACISYYPMAAHMLCNLVYALLLLRPTAARALAAGVVGSLALTLHNPVPHLLFGLPFFVWLALRPRAFANLGALLVGYLPLILLLGIGWHRYIVELPRAAEGVAGLSSIAPEVVNTVSSQFGEFFKLPSSRTIHARIAGLSKIWTWGAAALVVLAAYGYRSAPRSAEARVLGAALLLTFLGYFLVRFDQGHGWGYRYIHSAWFVLPVLASIFLSEGSGGDRTELRAMAAWAVVLSLLLANGLRLVQVEAFIARHLSQVPPLARPAGRGAKEIVFVDISVGAYTQDMVQNDPFLRSSRIVMIRDNRESTARFMAERFPGYERTAQGEWGEQWTARSSMPGQ